MICLSNSWGGLEINVVRWSTWLKGRGCNIFLYAYPDSPLAGRALSERLSVRLVRSTFRYGDLLNARQLAAAMHSDGVDIALVHRNHDLFLTVLSKLMARPPLRLVYVQHMQLGIDKKDWFHTWEYGQLDAWITPLPFLANNVASRTRLDPRKIEIIPFGIEIGRFTDRLPSKEKAREHLRLPGNVPIAGVVGRLDSKKGQHLLIEACAKVRRDGLMLQLLLVGDATADEGLKYTEKLESLIDEHGLSNCVHFRPHIEQIEFAYAAMDLFVLPSQSETYGMVTIEAMASGLPIIATGSGGTPDIVQDGQTGLLIQPDSVDQLASALKKLLDSPPTARSLSEQARRVAVSRYSHDQQCSHFERLFARLISDSAG